MTASGGGRDGEMDSQMVASRAPDVDRLAPLERNLEMVSDFDAARKRLEEYAPEWASDIRLLLDEVERLLAENTVLKTGQGVSTSDLERQRLQAEVERLRSEVVTQSDVSRKNIGLAKALVETQQAAKKAEAEVERLREALKVAREYVKATEGQLVTRPNIVTKDRELCDAALRGEGEKPTRIHYCEKAEEQIRELEGELLKTREVLDKAGSWVAAVEPKLPMPGVGDSQQDVLNMIDLALRGEVDK